jgi:hypothetical protein
MKACIQDHLLSAGKWRDTLGWKRSYSVVFVIPRLHRMAIWYVPYRATPDALNRAGDMSGGLYQTLANLTDTDGNESVLWKRQHKIAAYLEHGCLQFAILDTTTPEEQLVDRFS